MDLNQCDDFKRPLSEEVLEIAKRELREDDHTRKDSLIAFRKWLQKQPYIHNCRTDAVFLLRFLRAKKFSLPMAQEALLTYLATRQSIPNWFMNLNPASPVNIGLAENGHAFPLLERDDHGRKVIFKIAGAASLTTNHTVDDIIQSFTNCAEIVFDNEEDQIRGFVVVSDYKNMGLQILSIFTPTLQRQFIKSALKLAAVRLKQVHLLNIHPSVISLAQIALSFFSEKLQKRIIFHKDMESLYRYIPKEILPQEYGGKVPQKVMTDAWIQQLRESSEHIARVNEMSVDENWVGQREDKQSIMGCEGSFRLLQID